MKNFKHFKLFVLGLFTSFVSAQQYKDTIIEVGNKKAAYEYDRSWSKSRLIEEITIFKKGQLSASFKSSEQIIGLLNNIKVSSDACENGGFENKLMGWTGLSLKHGIATIPIENGLINNPGIAPLPFTGLLYSENYTSIETAGLDPIISVATPSFPLQKTAPGSSGTQSLRLGNDQPGQGAEGIAKRFVVTADNAKYYFQYAMVMDQSHSNGDGSVNGTEVFFIAEAVTLAGVTVDKIVDIGNPSNPFINATMSSGNGPQYYRNWRCAFLDLSAQIGNEVVIMFINSDCSKGGHNGYTYLDDMCQSCVNVNEGDIKLDFKPNGCIKPSQSFGGSFTIPASATNVNISLEIYQSNTLLFTNTSPTIVGSNYTFTVLASDFPNQTVGTCYDLVSVLTFDMIDLNGNVQTITQYSSKPVEGIQDGQFTGVNSDICFCEDNKGSYCCDAQNLVLNGNFEAGDSSFGSDYTQTATTFPGEYTVTAVATNFGATVTDHSFCADPIAYPTNNLYLVVNGKTQQTATTSTIWTQTVTGLKQGETYKFCANFKNMPQCTFDILPVVSMQAGAYNSGLFTVNTPSAACAWQSGALTFVASGTSETISITLAENGNGDGNDLAIDDIYVGKLGDPNLQITVQHDGTTNAINASLNTIANTDDTLHGNCTEYKWFVAEVTSFPGLTINWSSFASGNNVGSNLPPFAGTPSASTWNLTTNFPSYVFQNNKMYLIGMYTPACGCYNRGFTYQLTFNSNAKNAQSQGLTKEQEDQIIDAILNGIKVDTTLNTQQNQASEVVTVYPNPVTNYLNIDQKSSVAAQSISVYSITGKEVITIPNAQKTSKIDVSSLTSGNYIIKIITEEGSSTKKFIKK